MNKQKYIQFTFLPSARSKKTYAITLYEFLNEYTPMYRKEVLEYRATGDKEIKLGLPAIIPAAIMKGGHSYKCFKRSTGYASFDVDGIEGNVEEVKVELSKDPYIALLMLSASGKGLWGLIYFGTGGYGMKYEALFQYFQSKYNITLDPTGANMNRLRFISWDDDPYWNPSAKKWTKKRGMRVFKMAENGVTLDLNVDHNVILRPSERNKIRTFNRVFSCEEILDRNNWILVSVDSRDRVHYLRPGATSHETSGNIANGRFYCWTSSTELKENKLYTPFDLFVALEHKWSVKKALSNINYVTLKSRRYGQVNKSSKRSH